MPAWPPADKLGNKKVNALVFVYVTVRDPRATAQRLCELFGWKIRWEGSAIHDGYTVHVGSDDDYVAVYSSGSPAAASEDNYERAASLNHIGVVVDDLEATEELPATRILAAGLQTHSHADYEPGRRFYFYDPDGIEFEVISYA